MNWHKKNDWTGYSFDTNLYPNPADLGDMARNAQGLMTLVNLHDADGVGNWENEFQPLCDALGIDCSGLNAVPADFTSRKAMNALEDIVWQPLQEQFADYAWIDWQQVRLADAGTTTLSGCIRQCAVASEAATLRLAAAARLGAGRERRQDARRQGQPHDPAEQGP